MPKSRNLLLGWDREPPRSHDAGEQGRRNIFRWPRQSLLLLTRLRFNTLELHLGEKLVKNCLMAKEPWSTGSVEACGTRGPGFYSSSGLLEF